MHHQLVRSGSGPSTVATPREYLWIEGAAPGAALGRSVGWSTPKSGTPGPWPRARNGPDNKSLALLVLCPNLGPCLFVVFFKLSKEGPMLTQTFGASLSFVRMGAAFPPNTLAVFGKSRASGPPQEHLGDWHEQPTWATPGMGKRRYDEQMFGCCSSEQRNIRPRRL